MVQFWKERSKAPTHPFPPHPGSDRSLPGEGGGGGKVQPLRDPKRGASPGISFLGSDHQGGKAKLIGNINLNISWGKTQRREINMLGVAPWRFTADVACGGAHVATMIHFPKNSSFFWAIFCGLTLPCLIFLKDSNARGEKIVVIPLKLSPPFHSEPWCHQVEDSVKSATPSCGRGPGVFGAGTARTRA